MGQLHPFEGVLVPVLTPFHADLRIDGGRFVEHCRRLLAHGAGGLAVLGTTSEANSLSIEERMALLDALVEAGIDPALLMPGTGCCALSDTVRLTAHAARLGCGGVLLLPPFYYKGVSDEGLYRNVAEVIGRVGDSRLRVYLYHIPPVAQVGYSLALIERLIADFGPTIAGIKDSSGDWRNTEAVLRAFPGLAVFPGSEVFLLAGLRAGARGCITASGNVNAAAIARLFERWETPEADRLQEEVSATRRAIEAYPMIPALKAIVEDFCRDPGWSAVRPPLTPLDVGEARALLQDLAQRGLTFASGRNHP